MSGTFSPIRERTRNAIALHRAWRRPEARRRQQTDAGAALPATRRPAPAPPEVQSSYGNTSSSTNSSSLPAADYIYQDIEDANQEQSYQPYRPPAEDFHQRRSGPQEEILSTSVMEDHLEQLEHQILSTASYESSKSRSPYVQSGDEQASHPAASRSGLLAAPQNESQSEGSEGFDASAVQHSHHGAYDFQKPEPAPVPQLYHPIVYRDDGSVMTGMSQQELIRKKVRTVRRKERRFGNKKPVVQMPANFLLPAARIATPQHHLYKPQNSVGSAVGAKKTKRTAKRSRPRSAPAEEQESLSTTAETTNASRESAPSPVLPHSAPSPGGCSAAGVPSKLPRAAPALAVRGDDTVLVDSTECSLGGETERSLGEESFPVLSRNSRLPIDASQSVGNDCSNNDASSNGSTASTARRGVRFAGVTGAAIMHDDESSMPWDQKTDLNEERSPASVIENIEGSIERKSTTGMPKSILRSPRFKPKLVTPTRYRCNERPALDLESERLMYHGGPNDSRLHAVGEDYEIGVEGEPRALDGEDPQVTSEAAITSRLSKGRLKSTTEADRRRDVSPPRCSIGFLEKEGSELSPIQPDRVVKSPPFRVHTVPLSHVSGHPAEKHLLEKMATFRGMRGGDIADRIIEEDQYPDPPLELDVRTNFLIYLRVHQGDFLSHLTSSIRSAGR